MHIWLPKAMKALIYSSIILAGILLKMRRYKIIH